MSKHTPGPWEGERRSATIAVLAPWGDPAGSRIVIAEIYGLTALPKDEAQANSATMIAAPELLAEARRIHDRLARQIEAGWPLLTDIEHDDYVRLAKVIAKAETPTL